jgi:enamine deaminase RidA (YjgF/YER057c/UK114 family)
METKPMHQILQPEGWMKPKGYSNGIAAAGRHVFVAGQIGWNEQCVFEAQDFLGQFRQALKNVVAVLAEAGASPEHVTTMTWFVTDKAPRRSKFRRRPSSPSESGRSQPASIFATMKPEPAPVPAPGQVDAPQR